MTEAQPNFTLTNTPIVVFKPHNVIVKQGNNILNAGYNQQFEVKAQPKRILHGNLANTIGSFDNSNILAMINGKELQIATEYNIRPANSSIILEPVLSRR